MTFEEHCACDMLYDARDYLYSKSYNGDDARGRFSYADWQCAMTVAVAILQDSVTRIQLEATCKIAIGVLFDTEPAPRCEYRSPQFDSGTGVGQFIRCRNDAVMFTNLGLRCKDHERD